MFNIKKFNEINDFIKKTSNSTKIVAISKNHPIEKVQEAINAGVRIFGENRVQEAQGKFLKIKKNNPKIELHLTGPLQSNKVKTAIPLFDVFHTLDREKIAREFSKYKNLITNKKIFLQINIGKKKKKVEFFRRYKRFLFFLNEEMKISVSGLMCIPPIDEDPYQHFAKLKLIANENNITELSIGMSDDYEQALEFNPSYIRLGTILFGKRQ